MGRENSKLRGKEGRGNCKPHQGISGANCKPRAEISRVNCEPRAEITRGSNTTGMAHLGFSMFYSLQKIGKFYIREFPYMLNL